MASFLRKLCDLNCRSGNVLTSRLWPYQLGAQNVCEDGGKTNQYAKAKESLKSREHLVCKHGFSPHSVVQKECHKDLELARNLLVCVTNDNFQNSSKKKINKLLELRSSQKGHASQGLFDQELYLWCTGVLTLSGILFSHSWHRQDHDPLQLAPSLEQIVTQYLGGISKDHLILKINAQPTEIKTNKVTEQKKEEGTLKEQQEKNELNQDIFGETAREFDKLKEESVIEVLNTLGIHLYNSSQHKKAVMFFKQAASHGDPAALFNVGLCYEQGRGVPQSKSDAMKFYQMAADKGYPKAIFNLAVMLINDKEKLPKNKIKGIELMEFAAQHRIFEAQKYLGNYFFKQKNWEKAASYFQMAGKLNDPVALYHSGICHENGLGVKQDIHKAREYYLQAAKAGHKNSQFNTGVFYENGLGGLKKDLSEAIKWYCKAYKQGDEQAKIRMDNLTKILDKENLCIFRPTPTLSTLPHWKFVRQSFHKSFSSPDLLIREKQEKKGCSLEGQNENVYERYTKVTGKPIF